jgi:hypothetical protein
MYYLIILLNMTDVLLTIIVIILLLDFYIRHNHLIKKRFRKVERKITKKQDHFMVRNKGHGDKVAEDLEKLTS